MLAGTNLTSLIVLMVSSIRQHVCCTDMLKDCATEQELFWVTEEMYEEEEATQAAEDPNAEIDVQELVHDSGRCDPVPYQDECLLMTAGTCSLH